MKTKILLAVCVAFAWAGVSLTWAVETSAAGAADQEFAAFQQLLKKQPSVPAEQMPMAEMYHWYDNLRLEMTRSADEFAARNPDDPRRWNMVIELLRRPPFFIKGFGPDLETKGFAAIIPDEAA